MLNTAEQMKQFITLQQKSLLELQAIAEGLGLQLSDDKDVLISQLIQEDRKEDQDLHRNALIAIRISNNDARKLMLQFRKHIYDNGRYAVYDFFNAQGKKYSQKMKRILLKQETLQKMLNLDMLIPKDYTREVFEVLKQDPSMFDASLVLKKHSGTNWLMLCVTKKAA